MNEEKRDDEETLPDTPLHGHQEGRALDEGEDAEGGPTEQRSEGDESLGGPTTPAGPPDEGEQVTSGGGDTEGSDRTHDDTPPPDEGAGEEGLGTQSGGSGGGERSEPGAHDRPQ